MRWEVIWILNSFEKTLKLLKMMQIHQEHVFYFYFCCILKIFEKNRGSKFKLWHKVCNMIINSESYVNVVSTTLLKKIEYEHYWTWKDL